MRVLVTGIDGFVGSHLVDYLLTIPDAEIFGTIITKEPSPNLAVVNGRLRLRQADILNKGRIDELFHDIRPDRVVHLAAQAFVPTSVHDPQGTIQTNINGTMTILEAARSLRDREGTEPSVLLVSSSEVYGRVDPARQPITEEAVLSPGNPYAASKSSIDLIGQAYRRTYGLNVIVARPFNHAGPRQNPSFVTSEFGRRFAEFSLGRNTPVLRTGNLHVRRDFTDVRDVVRAYWALFEQRSDHIIFNVCSGSAVSIEEVIHLYGEISGLTPEIAVEQAKSRHYDIPLMLGSNQRIREATGWAPTIGLRDTLRDVFTYWRDQLTARA